MRPSEKIPEEKAGELKLSVFDILKQNQSISRTVTETYIQDAQSRVLQQYFMLTFTYNLKNFGKTGNKQQPASDTPSDMRPGSRGMADPVSNCFLTTIKAPYSMVRNGGFFGTAYKDLNTFRSILSISSSRNQSAQH